MPPTKSKKRTLYLDWLRVLGTVAVVVIHVCSPVVTQFFPSDLTNWWVAHLFDTLARWSVPVFVMISGAIVIPKVAELKKSDRAAYCWSRSKSLSWVLAAWILVYAVVYYFGLGQSMAPLYVMQRIIFDQPYEHLYFVFLIIFLTLLTPGISLVWSELSKTGRLTVGLGLLGLALFWTPSRFILSFWLPYLAYYWLGACLHTYRNALPFFSQRMWTYSAIASFGLASLAIAVGTYLAYTGQLSLAHPLALYEYLSLPVLISSLSLFLLISRVGDDLLKKHASRLVFLSKITFGIYLIHPAVLLGLDRLFGLSYRSFGSQLVGIPVLSISTLLVSGLMTWSAQKWKVRFKKPA